jgi:hypothetical protein
MGPTERQQHVVDGRTLSVEYYHDRKAPGDRSYQDWVEIDGCRVTFPGRLVLQAALLLQRYVVVRTTLEAGEGAAPGGNLFCLNIRGKLLWQAEPPRYADGSTFAGLYQLLPPAVENGRLVLYVLGAFPERFKDDAGAIRYEVDFATGKTLLVEQRPGAGGP